MYFFVSNVHSPYLMLWTSLSKTSLPCYLFCNYTKIQIKFITIIYSDSHFDYKRKKNKKMKRLTLESLFLCRVIWLGISVCHNPPTEEKL